MADLKVPELGESITEAVIGKWLKAVGEHVEADEPVVDLETDKITVQLPSPAAGALAEQLFAEGDTVHVGDVLGQIAVGAAGTPKPPEPAAPAVAAARAASAAPTPVAAATPSAASTAHLTPAQRRAQLQGKVVAKSAVPRPVAASPSGPTPVSVDERERVVAMSPLRKRIAERLVQAQQSSASLTTFNEVDLSNVKALRAQFKQQFLDKHGVKLGFMSFFVKAAVEALKLFPGLNAEVRGEAIVYKQFYDIGIAVGTPRGLVVPVLRGADSRSFAGIESGIRELAVKARDGKLVLSDLMGASFTVTNGGVYGSMLSTPLLNFPQTGILGMHNIVERAMVINGVVEVRPMMYLAVTYDHRVVDGKEAVSFLVAMKDRLENPSRLLLGV